MAEVDTSVLAGQHGDIRHDVAEKAHDLSHQIGDGHHNIRHDIAKEGHDLSHQVGTGFSDTRYNVASEAHGLSHQVGEGHANIRREVADAACALGKGQGDIRRETQEQTAELSRWIGDGQSDIRFEQQAQAANIIKEGLKNSYDTRGDVKDANYDVANRVENQGDRVTEQASRYYIANQQQDREAARDLATLTALQNGAKNETLAAIQQAIQANSAAVALESQKAAYQNAEGQYRLSKEIALEGEKTRNLINDHKYHDLNRALVERNTELSEERQNCNHWKSHSDRDYWATQFASLRGDQAQWGAQFAQLQSQMQNFNSQLNETRQGMVNFGTMAGVGQSSTNNNVR